MENFKKKAISLTLVLAMVVLLMPNFQITANAAEKDEYIVITKTDSAAEKIEDKYNVSVDETVEGANNILSGELTKAQAEKLEDMKNVECVEKDFVSEGEDNFIEPDVVSKEEGWENDLVASGDGENVGNKIKICIIDSGVDLTDTFDIAEKKNFIEEEDTVVKDDELAFEDEDYVDEEGISSDEFDEAEADGDESSSESSFTLFDDTCGHGTSVASVILGNGDGSDVEGLAQKATIYSAKILDENQQSPVSRAIKAIYWAIEQDVDIINMSFGTTKYSEALECAVNDAKDAGILVVASVGNNGNEGIDYPAGCESTLSVGAVNAAGQVSDFSSKGDKVDVVAPGEAITAQANFGEDMQLSGASLATPYVTALAAKLWSKDKSKPADFIKQLIIASGKTITSEDGHIDKLIDFDYANEIYDEAYKTYCEQKKEIEQVEEIKDDENAETVKKDENAENIEINKISGTNEAKNDIMEQQNKDEEQQPEIDITEEVEENPTDVEDIVKGSWNGATHTAVFEKENTFKNNLAMKAGATFPDNLTLFPYRKPEDVDSETALHKSVRYMFHGGGTWGSSFGTGDTNYMAAYQYIATVGREYFKSTAKGDAAYTNTAYLKGVKVDFWKNGLGSGNSMQKCFDKLQDIELTGVYKDNPKTKMNESIFKNWGKDNIDNDGKADNKLQSAFIMGMAMHTATDVLAHTTYSRTKISVKNDKVKKLGTLNGKAVYTKTFKKESVKSMVHIPHSDTPVEIDKVNKKIKKKCYTSGTGSNTVYYCCDDPKLCVRRAAIAKDIEQNIVNRYKGYLKDGVATTDEKYGKFIFDFYPRKYLNNVESTDLVSELKGYNFRVNKMLHFAEKAGFTDADKKEHGRINKFFTQMSNAIN